MWLQSAPSKIHFRLPKLNFESLEQSSPGKAIHRLWSDLLEEQWSVFIEDA